MSEHGQADRGTYEDPTVGEEQWFEDLLSDGVPYEEARKEVWPDSRVSQPESDTDTH